jgi:hypothetical protein
MLFLFKKYIYWVSVYVREGPRRRKFKVSTQNTDFGINERQDCKIGMGVLMGGEGERKKWRWGDMVDGLHEHEIEWWKLLAIAVSGARRRLQGGRGKWWGQSNQCTMKGYLELLQWISPTQQIYPNFKKYPTQKRAGRVGQVVGHLPSKREALSSNAVPFTKTERKILFHIISPALASLIFKVMLSCSPNHLCSWIQTQGFASEKFKVPVWFLSQRYMLPPPRKPMKYNGTTLTSQTTFTSFMP